MEKGVEKRGKGEGGRILYSSVGGIGGFQREIFKSLNIMDFSKHQNFI